MNWPIKWTITLNTYCLIQEDNKKNKDGPSEEEPLSLANDKSDDTLNAASGVVKGKKRRKQEYNYHYEPAFTGQMFLSKKEDEKVIFV